MTSGSRISIRVRLALWYGVVLAAAMALCGVVLFQVMARQLMRHHDPDLRLTARRVEAVLSQHEDCANLTPEQVSELDRSGHLVLVHEMGDERHIFYQSPDSEDAKASRDWVLRLGGEESMETWSREEGPWRIYTKPYQSKAGRRGLIRIMEPMGDVEEPMAALRSTLLWIIPFAALMAALGGYWLAARALAPVDQITRMAQSVGAKRLDLRIPEPPVADELGRLARTLNQMLERLDASFAAMARFTADASHELRSPLAVLRSTLDVTLSHTRSPQEYQEVLFSLCEEVSRLQVITEDLLLLAKADSGRIPLSREAVRLDVLARETLDHAGQGTEPGRLILQARHPVVVAGDDPWLRRLMVNLIENAIRHGQGDVRVTVSQVQDQAILNVKDQGAGIPPEHLPHVFERFYRADAARTPGTSEGTGLGLAISAWIVQAHGGTIQAANSPEGGAEFTVTLPGWGSEPQA